MYGWDCLLLTFIYPCFDGDSLVVNLGFSHDRKLDFGIVLQWKPKGSQKEPAIFLVGCSIGAAWIPNPNGLMVHMHRNVEGAGEFQCHLNYLIFLHKKNNGSFDWVCLKCWTNMRDLLRLPKQPKG